MVDPLILPQSVRCHGGNEQEQIRSSMDQVSPPDVIFIRMCNPNVVLFYSQIAAGNKQEGEGGGGQQDSSSNSVDQLLGPLTHSSSTTLSENAITQCEPSLGALVTPKKIDTQVKKLTKNTDTDPHLRYWLPTLKQDSDWHLG
jgi:hypothetical protein